MQPLDISLTLTSPFPKFLLLTTSVVNNIEIKRAEHMNLNT